MDAEKKGLDKVEHLEIIIVVFESIPDFYGFTINNTI